MMCDDVMIMCLLSLTTLTLIYDHRMVMIGGSFDF
jgi:hypothetical protein